MQDTSADIDKFEAYLKAHPFKGEPANLYEAMNYIMSLGGKRMRPKLLLLAYEAVKGQTDETAMKLALAIETFHNFTLLHDDIMDHAPLRRGKPSVHKVWNDETAILAGDNLLIQAYRLLVESGAGIEPVMREFTTMASQVCDGQQMDMNLPVSGEVTEAQYMEMIRLKTAVLPACALKIGGLAAGAGTETADSYYQFGINLGLAFQLQDDYLDSFGSGDETGKQEGGDIIENKKTILYIHAIQHLPQDKRAELAGFFNSKINDERIKVARVRELFTEAGSDQYLLALKEEYEQKALQHLELCTNENKRKPFLALFEILKTRRS